jgi:histidyl-tRNA synthetase
MDIIGEPGALADAELIAAAIDVLRALGLGPGDARARVSDRRVLQALLSGVGLGADHMGAAFTAIDRSERVPRPALAEGLQKAGCSDQAIEGVFRVAGLKSLPAIQAELGRTGSVDVGAPLAEAIGALEAMGLGAFVEVDLTIVRGLAYYTGIVFELFDVSKSLRAICGGGRYDGLLKALGGVDLPALGFGMGDVVLGELLKERGIAPAHATRLDCFLVPVGADDLPVVLKLAHDLRDQGLGVEYGLRLAAVRKQLELAAARGVGYAVIVGPNERAAGEAVVRDLGGGSERRVPLGQVAQSVRTR